MKKKTHTSGRSRPSSLILDLYCPGHRDRAMPSRLYSCSGCRTRICHADSMSGTLFEKGA